MNTLIANQYGRVQGKAARNEYKSSLRLRLRVLGRPWPALTLLQEPYTSDESNGLLIVRAPFVLTDLDSCC
jgi:hypothetical protein